MLAKSIQDWKPQLLMLSDDPTVRTPFGTLQRWQRFNALIAVRLSLVWGLFAAELKGGRVNEYGLSTL